MDYKPSGVCSRLIHVELDGDKIANVEFVGGCAGNTKGVAALARVGVLAVVVVCEVLGAGFALHDAVEHAGTIPEHDGEGEVLLLEVVGM